MREVTIMIIAEFRVISDEFLFGQMIALEAFDSMPQLLKFMREMRAEDFKVVPCGIFFSSEMPDIESNEYERHIEEILKAHYNRMFIR